MINRNMVFTSAFLVFISLAFSSYDKPSSENIKLGTYSISLSVKDIAKSKDFYENLGFKMKEGSGGMDQNWIIMTNGITKIGLFQGLFPSNTITFNPDNARAVYNHIKAQRIVPTFEMGMDKDEGPCTFSLMDPDGNPILIDQHN